MLATSQIFPVSLPSLQPNSLPDFSTGEAEVTVHHHRPDDELTSLNWLQNPGVLNTMCNALTGSPHRVSAMGTRSIRRPRSESGKASDKTATGEQLRPRKGSTNSAEKMLNVVLSVRNKRYNGEDSQKPPLSFACMIFMALESSPTKTLPVKQIYEWVQWKFPYYRTASPGWKNSIRHNLSLNKCFKKVEKFSRRSKSVVTKGGLWTVDPAYRESLLTALKLNPYHPYHKYFTPPYFPKSMIAALREELELAVSDKGLDAAERDAALSICLISGAENGGVNPAIIKAIHHDHCYTQLPTPPSTPTSQRSGLNLEEVLAAAEMILGGTEEVRESRRGRRKTKRKTGRRPTKQSGRQTKRKKIAKEDDDIKVEDDYNTDDVSEDSEEDEDETESTDADCSLADSGYCDNSSPPLSRESRSSSLDDLRGADALLCLANNSCPSSERATPPGEEIPEDVCV